MLTRRTAGQEFVWWLVLLILAGMLSLLLAAPAP
jgi:hypothetical protein